MPTATVDVKSGYWVDYSRSFWTKRLYLCTDSFANIWTNAVAIFIAVALARLILVLFKLVNLSLPSNHDEDVPDPDPVQLNRISSGTSPPPSIHTRGGHSHLDFFKLQRELDRIHSSIEGIFRALRRLWEMITARSIHLGEDGQNNRRGVVEFLRNCWRNIRHERIPILALLGILLICILFFVLESTMSIFSSVIITSDNIALSNSADCGLHRAETKDSIIPNSTRNIDQEVESDAGAYAKNCYDEPDGADGCNFFVQQKIDFTEFSDSPCPFDAEFCPEDGSNAYTMSTGLFTAADLGFNVEEKYTFNKTVTCTPLNMNSSFIREEFVNGSRMIEYYYGKYRNWKGEYNFTWSHIPESDQSLIPAYDVRAFTSTQSSNYWVTPPGMKRAQTATLLLLISSNHVLHTTPRSDPIFSTDSAVSLEFQDRNITAYTDLSHKFKALACIEEVVVCIPNGTYCRNFDSHSPGTGDWRPGSGTNTPEGASANLLMYVILLSSTLYSTIRLRLGTGLVATTKLSQAYSLPLPEQQWKVEVRRLFQTSLAEMQIHARDIERGRWANEPGLIDFFGFYSAEQRAELCGMYKFQAIGWKNINVIGSAFVLVAMTIITIVSVEIETKHGPIRWLLKRRWVKAIASAIRRGFHILRGVVVFLLSSSRNRSRIMNQSMRRAGNRR